MKTRKVFATVLALALAMGLSTTAFAAEGTSTHTDMPGTETIGVNGSYEGTGNLTDTYSVDIEWGEMTFTYKTTGDRTWDPETHTYSVTETDGWEAAGNTVKVTNHSNLPVNVAFSFEKEANVNGTYAGTMSVTEKQLAAGVENKPTEADFVESTLTLDGTLNALQTTSTKLGEITVALSAVTVEP